jgi:hypothetical protein
MRVDPRNSLHYAKLVFGNNLSPQLFLHHLCFDKRVRPRLFKRSWARIGWDNQVRPIASRASSLMLLAKMQDIAAHWTNLKAPAVATADSRPAANRRTSAPSIEETK